MAQDIQQYIPGLYSNSPITISAKHITGSGSATRTVTTVSSGFAGDYMTDGVDDNVEIQAAIDAVNALGGGTVFIRAGTYNIAGDITFCSNLTLSGEGEATVLKLAAATTIWNCTRAANSVSSLRPASINLCSNVKLLNFSIDCSSQNSTNDIAIWPNNVQNLEIAHLHIKAFGFGIYCVVDSTPLFGGAQDAAHIWIHHNYITGTCRQDCIGGGAYGNPPRTYVLRDLIIEDNFLVQDTSSGQTADYNAIDLVPATNFQFVNNTTQGNILFGNEADPHQYSSISNNNVRPPAGSTTLMCAIVAQDENNANSTSGQLLISGNILYGGHIRASGRSGQLIQNVNIVGNLVVNNQALTNGTVLNFGQEGVRCKLADRCLVAGNYCYGPSVTGFNGIVLEEATNCSVVSNYVDGYVHGVSQQVSGSGHFVSNNYIINNGGTAITAVTGTVRQNLGFVTENSGTATVSSGATTSVVTHGLGITPVAGKIVVTPTNSMGTATKFFVGTYTSTQFTITVDQDPGATTATFAWLARI